MSLLKNLRLLLSVCIFIVITTISFAQETVEHQVLPGETLYRISLQYGVSVDAIVEANGISDPTLIYAGQVLVIPVETDEAEDTDNGDDADSDEDTADTSDTAEDSSDTTNAEDESSETSDDASTTDEDSEVEEDESATSEPDPDAAVAELILKVQEQAKVNREGTAGEEGTDSVEVNAPTSSSKDVETSDDEEDSSDENTDAETESDNGDAQETYVVQRGDTLFSIAQRFGTSVDVLARLNGLSNTNQIFFDQVLIVSGDPPPASSNPVNDAAPPPPVNVSGSQPNQTTPASDLPSDASAFITNNTGCDIRGTFRGQGDLPIVRFSIPVDFWYEVSMPGGTYSFSVFGTCINRRFDAQIFNRVFFNLDAEGVHTGDDLDNATAPIGEQGTGQVRIINNSTQCRVNGVFTSNNLPSFNYTVEPGSSVFLDMPNGEYQFFAEGYFVGDNASCFNSSFAARVVNAVTFEVLPEHAIVTRGGLE